ncbi:hypothetical protein WN943_022987 [Citrus x changshan-huyou]
MKRVIPKQAQTLDGFHLQANQCHLKQGSDSSSSCLSPTSLHFTAYYNLRLDNNNCSIFALNKAQFEEEIFPARPDTIMLLKN